MTSGRSRQDRCLYRCLLYPKELQQGQMPLGELRLGEEGGVGAPLFLCPSRLSVFAGVACLLGDLSRVQTPTDPPAVLRGQVPRAALVPPFSMGGFLG